MAEREVKKLPLLRGKSVFNLFFENSTHPHHLRDRRAPVGRRDQPTTSTRRPRARGLLDTVDNLCAMQADMFVVRHAASPAPMLIAQHLQNTGRPTSTWSTPATAAMRTRRRACSTCTTIRHFKKDFTNLTVAIVGDVLHSRVARSQIAASDHARRARKCVIGPRTLLPTEVEKLGRARVPRHARRA